MLLVVVLSVSATFAVSNDDIATEGGAIDDNINLVSVDEQDELSAADVEEVVEETSADEDVLSAEETSNTVTNNTFFNEHEQTFYDGIKETGALIKDIQKNAIYLPQNKIPKADEILIDNVNTKKKTVTLKNGREVENTYVYLKKAWIYPHTVLKTD